MKYSFVVGFRNRDQERIKRYLNSIKKQTYTDFELIFIDYGSDTPVAKMTKELVSKYSFVTYIYNHTYGWAWNRAHALNTGVKISNGKFIIFSDIDLIYSENFLLEVDKNIMDGFQIFQQVFWLPQNYENWSKLENKPTTFNFSQDGAKGGVHIIEKYYLEEINSYDEYYCFWGVEDRDLYERISSLGIETKWLNKNTAPVYHQWHPIASNETSFYFPDKWLDNMNLYFSLNKDNLIRNHKSWGKLLKSDDRPIIKLKEFHKIASPIAGKAFKKASYIDYLIDTLITNKSITIKLNFPKHESKSKKIIFFNRLLKNNKYALVNKETLNSYIYREKFFLPFEDIYYTIWQLIKENNIVKDYYIKHTKEYTEIKLCI